MRSILMMVIANIRKRKMQSILLSITFLVSALMLSTAIGIFENITDPFSKMMEEQNGSQVTLLLEDVKVDTNEYKKWWESQDGVEGVEIYPYYNISDKISHNGELKTIPELMLTKHPGETMEQDKLKIVEGETKDKPAPGEIWLPTGFAYSNNIEIDDIFSVRINGEMEEFIVSAIIVDPQFSAMMIDPIRIWVNDEQGDYVYNSDMIGIHLSDYTLYNDMWIEFEDYLNSPFMGVILDYETVDMLYNLMQNIIGALLLVFSIIIIMIVLIVIAFTISNTILSDFNIIGILKAQGLSSNNIKAIYILQYILLLGLFVPFGIFFSQYLVEGVMSQVTKSLGIKIDVNLALPGIISLVVMIILVFIISLLSSSKAGKIKPADAIRNKLSIKKVAKKNRLEITNFSKLPVSCVLGLKDMVTRKRRALFIILSSCFLAFVLVFSMNDPMGNMDENATYWGLDKSDVYITKNNDVNISNSKLSENLYSDNRVKAVVPFNYYMNCAISAQDGKTARNVIAMPYDGDMNSIGMDNLKGENPVKDNEVAISVLISNKYNKSIGDTIELFVENEKVSFIITGIYQSTTYMGWSVRFQENVIRNIDTNYESNILAIKLKDKSNIQDFIKDKKELLGEDFYNIRGAYEDYQNTMGSISENLTLVSVILSVIFIIISFVIIFNTTLMDIFSDRKNYGIYKSIGMTPKQIRFSIIWKNLILTTIGVVFGIPLALVLTPKLMSALLTNMGMVNFPLNISVGWVFMIIPICFTVSFISAWIPSSRILKINPRNLIIE